MSTVQPMLRIQLIGRPRLELDGVEIEGPRGKKTWALLGRLVRTPEPVSRRRLTDELFGEADDPMGALRWALAELRRRTGAGDAFRGNPVVAGLGASAEIDAEIDVVLAADGEFGAEIPQGEFLEGIDLKGAPQFDAWLLIERQKVSGELLAGLRQAALRSLAAHDYRRAIDLAGAMVARSPYEEGPHILLVKALAASGDSASAAQQVEAAERLFVDELGVSPSAAVRDAARPTVAAPVPGVSSRASAASLLEAGLAAVSAGAVDAGIECLRRASSDAESSGDRQLTGSCLLELGTALVHSIRGFDDEGSVVLSAAAEAAEAAGDQLSAAKAKSELGYVDVLAGRRRSAERYLDEARALAGDDIGLAAAVVGFQGMNQNDLGQIDRAMETFHEGLELSRRSGVRRREIWTLGIGSRTLFAEGKLVEAEDWARRACELAKADKWTAFRPWPESWLAHARLAQGVEPAQVRADAEASFAMACQLGDPCWEGITAKVIGLSFAADGDFATGLQWIGNASGRCGRETDPYTWLEAEILLAEARMARESGDVERAEAAARRAVAAAAGGMMDGLLSDAMSELSQLQAG